MTLLPYPTYAETGVRWLPKLPETWRLLTLNALCLQISTGPFGTALGSDDYVSGGIPVINPSHIQNGGCVPDPDTSVSEETAARLAIWRLKAGDLVVARRGELGRSAIVLSSQDGWVCGTGSLRLTPEPARSCSRYLQAVMEAAHTREWLNLASVGSTMPNISETIIGRLPVAVPPSLGDQIAIGAFLDRECGKIDVLVAEQERLIALLTEKRQAVISHAVTKGLDPTAPMKDSGVAWLGQVPAHWEVKRLKFLVRSGTSISYGIVQPGEHHDDGVPFVQTTNMSSGDFDAERLQRTSAEIAAAYPRTCLEGGEVLLGIRASIGAAHIVPNDLRGANLSRGVARIVADDVVSSSFLVAALRSDAVAEYWALMRQGSTFNEVSIETVRELAIAVPPPSEQETIAGFAGGEARAFDTLTTEAERAIALLKERRAALISAAVTGKIDVRGLVAPTIAEAG